MKLRTFTSTAVRAAAMKSGVLVVVFTSGSVYAYEGVPTWLYASLCRAKSTGKFYTRRVRGQFPAVRVA